MTDDNTPGGGMPFDLGALMQKARDMQQNMQNAQAEAQTVRVKGDAGGGMVVAEANGAGAIIRITIEPSLLETGDKEMIEDLTTAAVNQALARAKEAMQEQMSEAAGGLPIPFDLSKLF